MTFDPYLHFQGNARAALEAYREIFGGTVEITTFAEMPEAPAEMRASDGVMHGTLRTDGGSLMASDFPPGMAGDPQKAVSISHEAASAAEARRIFDALAQGGR